MDMEEANNNIKELFSKGTAVEVNPGGMFRASWYSATISRSFSSSNNCNKNAKVYVKYHNQPISSANPDLLFKINPARTVAMSKPRSEWVKGAHVRPVQPLVIRDSFELGDEVGAYMDGGWWEGNIYENLGDNKYRVELMVGAQVRLVRFKKHAHP